MLRIHQVQEVQRLLADAALSQREIAKKLRISRGTVNSIATGKRGTHGLETPSVTDISDRPPQRCPTCGVMVKMPCVCCQAVDYNRRLRKYPPLAGGAAMDASGEAIGLPAPYRPGFDAPPPRQAA